MTGPLSGLRFLGNSTLLPGPMATLFPAGAGAKFIEMARPGHSDEMRISVLEWGPDSVTLPMPNALRGAAGAF